ncbi:Ger(x)C family spore germination protein [Paenibacillus albiflavus]|uniref:Ger(X)C family spore germination protein n=1 Tax=Paenibacillus albiflavus TaxID=2545760 RepID=A0A4R4E6Q1_9BACL|nr:Ger(x)C family spore germination protein [Paenibacillus albiflavus]TCZ75189.1 Ger(x)C family spore germination protein [Paenibacillus albiflavus]
MRTKLISITVSLLAAMLLSGCWDQQMLKDTRIVDIAGFDLNPQGKLQITSSILDIGGTQSGKKDLDEIHSATGNTTKHTQDILDRKVSGIYSASKLQVVLFGEALAKQGIYSYLDVYYRDPRSALNAMFAVTEGTTHDIILSKKKGNKLIGEHFNKLIHSAERRTIVPKVSLQLICPHMLDQGNDFAAPYFSKYDSNPSIYGIALFSGDRMTGKLKSEESMLYLLMADKLSKTASLTLKINKEEKQDPENYIAIDVQNVKRNLKVTVKDNNNIRVDLDLKIKATVNEYAEDHVDDKHTLNQLDRKLSEEFTTRAKTIAQYMLQINHDGFGIGRRVMAYYPATWKKLNWAEDYRKVEFDPKVSVEIVSHGIMN